MFPLLSLILIVLTGCATTGPTGSVDTELAVPAVPVETVRLYVSLSTTSDWSDLVFPPGAEITRGMITGYSQGARPGLNPEVFGLNQEITDAEAGVRVSAEAIIRVPVDQTGELRFGIARGHIGETVVQLFGLSSQNAQHYGSFSWAGIDEDSAENIAWFAVDLTELPGPPDVEDFSYPAEILDEIFEAWIPSVEQITPETYDLYWPDAVHTVSIPNQFYESRNAVEALIADEESGPDPDYDYSLITFSPPVRFPAAGAENPKYVTFGTYGQDLGWVDLFWFEERGGEWRIVEQILKIGVEIP